ncbi:hypothetical protein [Nocardiopsis sp. YSL2]|nr:hypothetical protein [Nocardiopsis sp. YSL2]
MTITEFLAARLDEYEGALEDATSGPPNSPAATLGRHRCQRRADG